MPASATMSETEIDSGVWIANRLIAARTISARREGRFAGRAPCVILTSMPPAQRSRSDADGPERVPAHRPSRRHEIVQAAIRVFADTLLSQATVEQVAAECGVAVTAVYYHFASK